MRRGVAAFLTGLMMLAALPAQAANWLEQHIYMIGPRYDAVVPACDYGLGVIAARFATKEGRFWNSSLQIVDFANVRETALRPWAEQSIPRRFCSAQAMISDGLWRRLDYVIAEDTGLIGASWGVEWCVTGLDRNWANNPSCRMARP